MPDYGHSTSVSIKAPNNESLHRIVGLSGNEELPAPGDLVMVPNKTTVYRVMERFFVYGSNGDFGTCREVTLYVEPVE